MIFFIDSWEPLETVAEHNKKLVYRISKLF